MTLLKEDGSPRFEAWVTKIRAPEETKVLLELNIKDRKGRSLRNWRACNRWIYFNRENCVNGKHNVAPRPESRDLTAYAGHPVCTEPCTKNPFRHFLLNVVKTAMNDNV